LPLFQGYCPLGEAKNSLLLQLPALLAQPAWQQKAQATAQTFQHKISWG
jgi:hypothetical protein